jgi:nucleolar protein 14
LDNDWKEMHKLMNGLFKKSNLSNEDDEKVPTRTKKDQDYDSLVQTLKFDLKAQPTDKLKSPEELEKDKLKALEEAEEELLKRMLLDEDDAVNVDENDFKKLKTVETTHRSADDIDFNDFEYESSIQKKRNVKRIVEERVEESKKEKMEKDNVVVAVAETKDVENLVIDNEDWFKNFLKVCDELSNEKIKIEDFDKKIREIIKKLNPGLNENNKKRLYMLCQHLIEYYKGNCLKRDLIDYGILDHLSKIIFHLSTVYLKDQIGELFHGLIKEYKNEIDDSDRPNMPNLDVVLTIFFSFYSIKILYYFFFLSFSLSN